MSWSTPTLRQVRMMVRDDVTAALSGAVVIGNSVLRVMSDVNAGLAHLVLRYIDWLARQLLPDTAETEWLDRHGDIWLVNSDNSTGRKAATLATGTVTLTGTEETVVPSNTKLNGFDLSYETTEEVTLGLTPTAVAVRALDGGAAGNLEAGITLSFDVPIIGVDPSATVVELYGGVDEETDDLLRTRVLDRIRQPPMGGDAQDYVQWALAVPGVTRAWSSPNEMGIGTCTLRFMMDELRATTDPSTNGFPTADDIAAVHAYLNRKRPVCVKDFFCEAPVPEPIDFTVSNLSIDSVSTHAAIIASVTKMLLVKGAPASAIDGVSVPPETIYAAWVSDAVLSATEVEYFDLTMTDHPMPHSGAIAVMGTATFV